MDVATQVALLFPQGKEITIKGELFTVKVMGIGKFPRVIKLLEPILPERKEGEGLAISYQDLFFQHSGVVIQVLALAVNKPLEWFDDVAPDEGLELLMTVAEVNVDFFMKRVAEKFGALPDRIAGLTAKT